VGLLTRVRCRTPPMTARLAPLLAADLSAPRCLTASSSPANTAICAAVRCASHAARERLVVAGTESPRAPLRHESRRPDPWANGKPIATSPTQDRSRLAGLLGRGSHLSTPLIDWSTTGRAPAHPMNDCEVRGEPLMSAPTRLRPGGNRPSPRTRGRFRCVQVSRCSPQPGGCRGAAHGLGSVSGSRTSITRQVGTCLGSPPLRGHVTTTRVWGFHPVGAVWSPDAHGLVGLARQEMTRRAG
jgi:hypothetical protein